MFLMCGVSESLGSQNDDSNLEACEGSAFTVPPWLAIPDLVVCSSVPKAGYTRPKPTVLGVVRGCGVTGV